MLVRIAVAVVCVPLLLLAMLPSPPLVWTVAVALIAAVASFELLRAAGEEKISPACGAACGPGDKPEEKPAACGSACGAGDPKPTACGSACGAGGRQ